jgi:hypothetical protein
MPRRLGLLLSFGKALRSRRLQLAGQQGGSNQMLRSNIEHCRPRIAEEARCAEMAANVEARHAHDQMVMLYKA